MALLSHGAKAFAFPAGHSINQRGFAAAQWAAPRSGDVAARTVRRQSRSRRLTATNQADLTHFIGAFVGGIPSA